MPRPRKKEKEAKEKKEKRKKHFRVVTTIKTTKEVQASSVEEAIEATGEICYEHNIQVDEL